MVVGLVGAVMTAAYMTRCVWLTFFGEYRGHGHPHESPRPITVPLVILAVHGGRAPAGSTASGCHDFAKWTDNHVGRRGHGPGPRHRGQVLAARPPSSRSALALASAIAVAWAYYEYHAFGVPATG